MHYSKDDIIRMVEEEDVDFIRLQFTDTFGNLKNMAVTSNQLELVLDNRYTFDGAAWCRIWILLPFSHGARKGEEWHALYAM